MLDDCVRRRGSPPVRWRDVWLGATVTALLFTGAGDASTIPLIAAARYWMRRYQLSRTRWRGIRLGLGGSAWGFAAASWGWSILESLSLGWYAPPR